MSRLKQKDSIPVNVGELKAKLSLYLKHARQGQSITVYDRETPIAQIIQFQERKLETIPPRKKLSFAHFQGVQVSLTVDPIAVLLEERSLR